MAYIDLASNEVSVNAAVATGRGTVLHVQDRVKTVRAYVTIATTATVKIEVSADGTTFFDLLTGITASGIYEFNAYNYVAGNVTAWTSGAVTVSFEGR